MVEVHFVMSQRRELQGWEQFDGDIHRHWQKFVRSEWAWLVQTFWELKTRGLPVTASSEPSNSKINVMHADDYPALGRKHEYFVAIVVADRRVYFPSNSVFVQNIEQRSSGLCHWLPHWDQPGLIPRCGNLSLETNSFHIGFAGIPSNTINLDDLLAAFQFAHPVRFSILSPEQWNDLSGVDALVAVRDFNGKRHSEKPPTKLFNAWLAGVPFIGGMDSAYEQVGRPGVNYLQVSTVDELLEAVSCLQDPDHWVKFANAGAVAAKKYSRESTRAAWEYLLWGSIRQDFEAWENGGWPMKKLRILRSFLAYNAMRLRRRYLVFRGLY